MCDRRSLNPIAILSRPPMKERSCSLCPTRRQSFLKPDRLARVNQKKQPLQKAKLKHAPSKSHSNRIALSPAPPSSTTSAPTRASGRCKWLVRFRPFGVALLQTIVAFRQMAPTHGNDRSDVQHARLRFCELLRRHSLPRKLSIFPLFLGAAAFLEFPWAPLASAFQCRGRIILLQATGSFSLPIGSSQSSGSTAARAIQEMGNFANMR